MKKLLSILSVLLSAVFTAMPVSAVDDNRNIKVSTKIEPEYIVTIPPSVFIPFNQESTSLGVIQLDSAKLANGKGVRVTLLSANHLTSQEDPEQTIPYTIHQGDSVFDSQIYTYSGQSTELTLNIAREDWNRASAGDYEDTITFQIAYTDY